jgi:hypothetical protein
VKDSYFILVVNGDGQTKSKGVMATLLVDGFVRSTFVEEHALTCDS